MKYVSRQFGCLVIALVLSGFAARVDAAVITEFTSGTISAGSAFFGQSFTTPVGPSYNAITFNFFSDTSGGTTPSGAGTLFLLTQEYLGAPNALSSSTAGFLASSTGVSGGVFSFDPSVILDDGVQYFAYANTAFLVSGSSGDGYPGGNVYFTSSGSANFISLGGLDANFRVSGSAVAGVPEPASLALLGFGIAALGFARRRKR